jgi:hypothetical protein
MAILIHTWPVFTLLLIRFSLILKKKSEFKPRKGMISSKKLATRLGEGESPFTSAKKGDILFTFFSPLCYLRKSKRTKSGKSNLKVKLHFTDVHQLCGSD